MVGKLTVRLAPRPWTRTTGFGWRREGSQFQSLAPAGGELGAEACREKSPVQGTGSSAAATGTAAASSARAIPTTNPTRTARA